LPYFGRVVVDRAPELHLTMRRVALGFAAVATVGILMVLPFAPVVVTTLFGSPFADGGKVLQILLLSVPFYVASQVLRSGLVVARRQWAIGLIFVIAVPLNVALNLYLIPRLGVFGAAYASLTTSIYVLFGLTFLTLRRHKTSWIHPNVASFASKGLDE
jgi:O-antigen/teichoic acid export membrane protein